MSDSVTDARVLLAREGLVLPFIPTALRVGFRKRSPWCFSTRPVTVWPYTVPAYLHEALEEHPRPYALLAHAGHGINSYALHYFLVHPPLQLFIQVGWGGVYMDSQKATASVNAHFRLVAPVIRAVRQAVKGGRIGHDERLTVFASTFSSQSWAVLGPPTLNTDVRTQDWEPARSIVVLRRVIQWGAGQGRLRRAESLDRRPSSSRRSALRAGERDACDPGRRPPRRAPSA